MTPDLYSLPVGTPFRFCGGNQQEENNESCVAVSPVDGAGAYALTDTKPGGAGRELRFTEDELDAFAMGYARQRGLI